MTLGGNPGKGEHLLKVEERNRHHVHLSKISSTHVQSKYPAKIKVKYAAQKLSTNASCACRTGSGQNRINLANCLSRDSA
jgi:hypothetical protein